MSINLQPLEKYIPENSLELVKPLLEAYPVDLRIVKPRKTKFGDYRIPAKGQRHRISINANLNPFAFLITLLHEYAHLVAYAECGTKIKPHGLEWQRTFQRVCGPFLQASVFPERIAAALRDSLRRGHASSATSETLFRELKKFDQAPVPVTFVEELQDGSYFQIGKRVFVKGPKSRKRYKCKSVSDNRYFMVHPLAEVQPVKIR